VYIKGDYINTLRYTPDIVRYSNNELEQSIPSYTGK